MLYFGFMALLHFIFMIMDQGSVAYTKGNNKLDVVRMKKYGKSGLLITILMLQIFSCNQGFSATGKTIPVVMDGIPIIYSVNQMTQREKAWLEELLEKKVVFTDKLQEQLWIVSYKDLGIRADLVRLPIKERLEISQPFAVVLSVDEQKAKTVIASFYDCLLDKPKDAYFKISYNNEISIVPDVKGELLNYEQMLVSLIEEIGINGFSTVAFATDWVEPAVTEEALTSLGIVGLLGEYSTKFNGDDKNRTRNIWLASSSIGTYILKPGEIFSFNEVVGPRTKERGYGEAGVIINNQRVQDFGGGVCQVSSTLYNAARLADLAIVERHQHSVKVSYVPKGRDATVVYGDKDLKLQNNTPDGILIKSYFAYGQLTVKIFGGKDQQN